MLKLGKITLDAPFFQAPLSGYSDYAMRKIARRFGAPLTFAPVMLAKSAANPKVLTKPLFRPQADEHPIGAQILGSEPLIMAEAAKALENIGYDLLDLNFACPVPKVLRRQRGGFLLKHPERIMEIYRRVREAVSCPVLMKLRIGYGHSQQNRDHFLQIVSRAAAEGVDGLVIHGRSVMQRFKGSADFDILAQIKKQFPQTTIIGSGDIFDAEYAEKTLNQTGIDGVLLARGAIGNPWIFRDLKALLQGKNKPTPPTLAEQGHTIIKHFELVSDIYKKTKAVRFFRKFIVNYCRIHPHRKRTQQALLSAKNTKDLLTAINHCYSLK
jgi:nifR3 family TIM-barrel protein